MDRCVVLVDGGYLLGAAGTLLGGDPDRAALDVDHAPLMEALIAEAGKQTGMPVLRLLWYAGAFNSQPTHEHRTIRVLPDVKVRLGELVKRGGRIQQKGVDSYLQHDLTALARNHAVADVVLVGGTRISGGHSKRRRTTACVFTCGASRRPLRSTTRASH